MTALSVLLSTVLTGIGATACTDAWALLRRRWLGVPFPNYPHVGRWIAHMRNGTFRHDAIAQAAPVRGEAWLGWIAHYAIGIAFAALLPVLWGPAWFVAPTWLPALAVGIATVAAPYLLLQPGMGAGLAGRRTPQPNRTRLHSLAMHAVFGVGLYLTALALRLVPLS